MPSRTDAPTRQTKPRCAFCGKLYGHRRVTEERIVVEIGQPIPGPKSNHLMVKEDMQPPLPKPGEPDEYRRGGYVPMDADPGSRLYSGHYSGRKGRSVVRTFWDGTYGTPYDPFCTLRCAQDFARAAYRAGYRITKKPVDAT